MSSAIQQPRIDQDPLALKTCPECGYSLQALPSEGVCPECGERYDQQYVVLFGETPEGERRRDDRFGIITACAIGAIFTFFLLRRGELMTPIGAVIVSYFGAYLLVWLLRRGSVRRDILFQVWMNERGVAVRRPRSEAPALARVFKFLQFGWWPVFTVAMVLEDTREAWVGFAILIVILMFAVISIILRRPVRSRRIGTGDARVPTLTRWCASDSAEVEPLGPDSARVRILSRSYLGPWKWHQWSPVNAVVRMGSEQVIELRRRMDRWISARLHRQQSEEPTHV